MKKKKEKKLMETVINEWGELKISESMKEEIEKCQKQN